MAIAAAGIGLQPMVWICSSFNCASCTGAGAFTTRHCPCRHQNGLESSIQCTKGLDLGMSYRSEKAILGELYQAHVEMAIPDPAEDKVVYARFLALLCILGARLLKSCMKYLTDIV